MRLRDPRESGKHHSTHILISVNFPASSRKKLEPESDKSLNSRVDGNPEHIRNVEVPEPDTTSLQVEVPPWAEAYEVSTTEMEGVSFAFLTSPQYIYIPSRSPTS